MYATLTCLFNATLRHISSGSLWGWKEFSICCFGELFISEESANAEILFPPCVCV